MRTLSATLLAAQKAPTRNPYVKVEIRPKIGAATRLDWQRIYTGSEPDYYHAATCPGDGSLIRARIAIIDSTRQLYRQRVTNPDQGADFSPWTYIAYTSVAGTALASYGANVIHFWADTNQKTIKYQESSDNGVTWGSIQTLYTTTYGIYHLAAAMKPNGDVCLFYFEFDVIKAVKRVSGTWGSPATWTNSLDVVSGMATAYQNDWNLVISGRNASNQRGVWSGIYGDGGSVSLDTWSALKEILLSDNTNVDYKYPSLTYDGIIHRLTLLELYSGGPVEGYYKRPYLSFQTPQSTYLDNLWREPYPFNLSGEYGLAIAKVPTKIFLSIPSGVWQAILSSTALDVTPDVLELRQVISPPSGRGSGGGGNLVIELDNSRGQYANFNKKGCEILVSPGYNTTAGDESSPGPSFWIESGEYLSQPSKSSLIIHATDVWGLLQNWQARRQITWTKDSFSVKEILIWLLSRIGIPLVVTSQSSVVTSFKPAFTIHPGESALAAVKRLLGTVPDVLLFREAVAYLKHPQSQDPTDYAYFLAPSSNQHPLLQGRYGENSWQPNWIQVWGTETPLIRVDRIQWDELERVYDRLHQVQDLNLNTVLLAQQRGDALLRKAEISSKLSQITVPTNCGQELWDVVEVNDSRAGFQAKKYRLVGLEVDFSPLRQRYQQKLSLGTP